FAVRRLHRIARIARPPDGVGGPFARPRGARTALDGPSRRPARPWAAESPSGAPGRPRRPRTASVSGGGTAGLLRAPAQEHREARAEAERQQCGPAGQHRAAGPGGRQPAPGALVPGVTGRAVRTVRAVRRSEEHTSELQSRENLVCRLLLEK